MNEIDRKLFELFSDKTLSEGCVFCTSNGTYFKFLYMDAEEPIKGIYNRAYYVGQRIEDKKDINKANINKVASIDLKILGHPPQLHDVFRVAKEKGLVLNITKREWEDLYCIHVYGRKGIHNGFIAFINPALPLLAQEDSTKQALINLFT